MILRFEHYLLLSTALFSMPCFSEPVGGEITSGSGQIETLSPNTTLVTQDTNTLSINWQSLNLSADESLRFEQPTSQSTALNFILDQQPSNILGKIDANGRIFLMNPNGIVFGESARINVGALAAGAFQVDEDLLNGSGAFAFNTGQGLVENNGKIAAPDGGSVALIGQTVSNNGEITAQLGKVHLLSADTASLSFDTDGLIQFSISKESLENASVAESAVYNSGVLQADGGYVVLQAHAAKNIYNNVVNNEGLIQANSISNVGGVIRLEGIGGNVINSGDLHATGMGEMQTGGDISLFGDRVGVFGNADIDASGSAGGGNIAIGGYRKGAGNNVSEFTQVTSDTTIRADAITQGDGGEIVIWADDTTWATGTVSAPGGAIAGDGGFVEISGKQGLVLSADVNLTANNGSFGTLLLDPTDIVIHDTPQGDDGLLPDLSIATVPGLGVFNIGKPALETLAFGSHLKLEATNNITINDLSGDNSLDFIINNTGSITMTADAGVADGLGSFTMNTGDTITTQGGSLTIAGAGVTLGTLNTGAGAITINSTRSVDMGAATSASQAVNVSVDSDNNGAETLTLRGALSGSSVNLQGGTNGGDTLIAPDSVNTWALTALNAGTLNGNNFSFFPNLTGGSLDDTFSVTGIGSIGPTGKFDGGNHTTGDTVDYSGSPTIVSLVLNGNILNVENIIGNGAASSLTADNVPNTWVISSENDGAVAGISFVDFSNLNGGTDTDDFTLNGGSVTGIVNGGGGVGVNSLTANDAANSWNILSADSGNIVGDVALFANIANLTGGSFADTFVLNAGSVSGTIDGGGGNDILSADNVANMWNITANNAGDVTGVGAFQNIENLNGRNDTDDFSVDDGFSISGTIDGGSGVDTIDLSSQTAAVIVDLGGTSYANFEEYTGNGSDSTLIAANVANVWSINGSGDGVDDGTVGGIAFVNFNNLTGGSDTDTFSLSSGTLSGTLNGGGGIDTLVGDNTANTWNITVADAGVATGVGSFSSVENLTGNIDTDNFIFADSSSLTGVINGSLGSDVVNFSAETGTVTVTMGSSGFANIETFFGNGIDSTLIGDNVANSWLIDGVDDGTITYPLGSTIFTNFNNLTGGSSSDIFTLSSGSISGQIDGGGGVNSLVGDNVANTWIITGADSGTASGVSGFSNIGSLTGNLLADSFIFTDPGSLSGSINGSDGVDIVNYSAKTGAVSVDLSNASVVSIETFIGNNTNSTLFGDDVANTWSISGVNDGTLGIISFVDFNNLSGNDSNDDFQLLAGGGVTGTVVGGLGSDSLKAADSSNSWNITGPDVGNLNGVLAFSEIEILQGGTAADTFIFSDGASFGGMIDGDADTDIVNHSAETAAVNIDLSSSSFANIESFIGNGSNSTLLGPGVDSTWLVTGVDNGTVNGVAFAGFNNVTGNTLDDTFQINGGSITGNLSGGIGADTLIADDVINTWNILGTDTGNVTNVATFSQVENIVGGSMFDAFVYNNGADITGNVDGGLGSDSVDYSAELGALTISLSLSDFSNIELFIGNNIDSTFIGPVNTNNWVITGNNDGTIGTVSFNNFNNLVGNVTADYFNFQNGSAITGSIDGDTGLDTVDFSLESGVVNVAIGTAGFTRIETFIGNDASSTLIGDNIANTWIVNDINDGTVGAITFFGFNNLTGNAGIDDFNLNGGSITGTVNGAGGVNSITADNVSNAWTITAANSGNVTGISAFTNIENLNGNAGTDIYTFSDGSSISGIIDGGGAVDVIDQSAQSGAISLTIGSSGYANIESFIGNGGGSTLTGENIANSWTITSLDSGTVGATNFTNISNLQGGNGDDSFTINGGSVSGIIDGGSGSDLILAGNVVNTWNITGTNSGNVTNINSFNGIETLQGNSGTDNYVFADGSNFTGIVDGAGGLLDLVDYSSETSAVTVSLASSQFQNIESYVGNSSNSTLVGENSSNAWLITGSNSGSVNGINFTGFNNVTGNSSVDTFVLSGGNITGIIDGDTGNDTIQADNITNTWNVTNSDTGNLTNVNAFQNIDNLTGGNTIDTFNINANLSGAVNGAGGDDIFNLGGLVVIGGGLIGGSGTDVLSGPTQNSSWNITAADNGSVNGITFSQIETLNGGIGDDTFNVANSASAIITGGISGGSGNDDIFIDYVGASSRTINFDGGAGIDSISLIGSAAGLNNDYVFPAVGMVNITSTTGLNIQDVTGTGIEIVTDSMTADGINLVGSNGNDAMQISPGLISGSQPTSFQIAGMPALQFSNKNNLSIDAGFGADSITVNGVVNVAGDINIASEIVNQGAGGQLRTNTLSFNQATSIGSSLNPLTTSVNTLALNGSTVDAYILEENALSASVNSLSGALSITAIAGDITSSGYFNITGTSDFNVADGASIVLDDLANQISGTPIFSSAGTLNNLVLMNNRAIDLPDLSLAGDLTIISTGDVTQSGVLSVQGNTSIDANANSIILNDAANDFIGSVSVQNSGASNTAIYDVNSLQLASSNIGTGTLVISAGDINQSGPIVQSANAGTVTVTASSGDIALTNTANEFTGSVIINNTGGGDSALTDGSELTLASSVTNGGDLTVTANNEVNLTGTTTSSGGDITITSNTGDIQLGRLDSAAGRLTINAATGNVLGNNSPITDPNLNSQTLEIIAGATIGDFNNPISIFVPTGGTSFFLAGQGSANIIGITGTVLPGSVLVNNVTNSNIAVGKGQSVSFLENTLSPTQAFLSPLYDVSGGGIHSYQFELEPGLDQDSNRRDERHMK